MTAFAYLMFGGGGGGLGEEADNNSNDVILWGVNTFLKSLRWVIVGLSLSFMPSASLGHKWQCRANNHSTSGLQKSITPHKITLLLYCHAMFNCHIKMTYNTSRIWPCDWPLPHWTPLRRPGALHHWAVIFHKVIWQRTWQGHGYHEDDN